MKLSDLIEILDAAILAHLKIVKIHPFTDVNGRTARLLMNTILMQGGLPPINILLKNRKGYLENLENSTTELQDQFVQFCLNQYNQNLETYLETFTN